MTNHNYCFSVADYGQEHCLHVNEADQISLENNTDDGGEVEMEGKLNICFSSSPPLNEMGSSPPHLIKLN